MEVNRFKELESIINRTNELEQSIKEFRDLLNPDQQQIVNDLLPNFGRISQGLWKLDSIL